MINYNSEKIEQRFDLLGVKEHTRLKRDLLGKINFTIHTYYLNKYITRNNKVLEIGAGTGVFTKELAQIGAKILVTDISQVQLDLNRQIAKEEGYFDSIIKWQKLDLIDLSSLNNELFDHIVVYGGPFSFVLDKKEYAFQECLKYLKPNGCLFFSVPSFWGHMHDALIWNLELEKEKRRFTIETGDLCEGIYKGKPGNSMHLYTLKEIKEIISKNNLQLLSASSSGNLAFIHTSYTDKISYIENIWTEYIDLEISACSAEGACEMGDYIIIVARKNLNEGQTLRPTT